MGSDDVDSSSLACFAMLRRSSLFASLLLKEETSRIRRGQRDGAGGIKVNLNASRRIVPKYEAHCVRAQEAVEPGCGARFSLNLPTRSTSRVGVWENLLASLLSSATNLLTSDVHRSATLPLVRGLNEACKYTKRNATNREVNGKYTAIGIVYPTKYMTHVLLALSISKRPPIVPSKESSICGGLMLGVVSEIVFIDLAIQNSIKPIAEGHRTKA